MDNTLLLTGATGILGRALARHFTSRGWRVVATSRDPKALEALGADAGKQLVGLAVDLRPATAPRELLRALDERGLCVTHLVNGARSLAGLAIGADGTTGREAFLEEFELDVVVPYELTLALAGSKAHRLRAVVNLGSQYGLVAPNPALYDGSLRSSPVQYGVAKAGVHHLTRELAVRLMPQGIRVNCVAFGGVEGRADAAFRARYAALTPSGRMLTASEIPGPVEFLLGEQSSAVNGQVLVADGGWTLW